MLMEGMTRNIAEMKNHLGESAQRKVENETKLYI